MSEWEPIHQGAISLCCSSPLPRINDIKYLSWLSSPSVTWSFSPHLHSLLHAQCQQRLQLVTFTLSVFKSHKQSTYTSIVQCGVYVRFYSCFTVIGWWNEGHIVQNLQWIWEVPLIWQCPTRSVTQYTKSPHSGRQIIPRKKCKNLSDSLHK